MQAAGAVGVLVEGGKAEARGQLAAQLLLHGVGELDAAVVFLQLTHLAGVFQRIEGEAVDHPLLGLVHRVAETVVVAPQQRPAGLEHPVALPENGSTFST